MLNRFLLFLHWFVWLCLAISIIPFLQQLLVYIELCNAEYGSYCQKMPWKIKWIFQYGIPPIVIYPIALWIYRSEWIWFPWQHEAARNWRKTSRTYKTQPSSSLGYVCFCCNFRFMVLDL